MTTDELITKLLAVPAADRQMPVVLTLWTERFHAFGEQDLEVDADGEFLSISARRTEEATR